MAEIICRVNTDSKEFEVTVDGAKVDGVNDFSVYQYSDSDKPMISIRAPKKMDNGLVQVIQYYSDSSEIERSLLATADINTVPGFFGVETTMNDICKYFTRKL